MRHRMSGRQLNRNASNRKALFRSLVKAIVDNEIIKTTLPKAKELRMHIEPLITLAKEDTTANRRLAFARVANKDVVTKLFNELGPLFKERKGGYTRVLKCGFRPGDKAPMAYIEFVEKTKKEELNK